VVEHQVQAKTGLKLSNLFTIFQSEFQSKVQIFQSNAHAVKIGKAKMRKNA